MSYGLFGDFLFGLAAVILVGAFLDHLKQAWRGPSRAERDRHEAEWQAARRAHQAKHGSPQGPYASTGYAGGMKRPPLSCWRAPN